MKTTSAFLFCFMILFASEKKLCAQNIMLLSNSQAQGGLLAGLGFTFVAYTASDNTNTANRLNQNAVLYAVGSAMMITGAVMLFSRRKSTVRQNYSHGWAKLLQEQQNIRTKQIRFS